MSVGLPARSRRSRSRATRCLDRLGVRRTGSGPRGRPRSGSSGRGSGGRASGPSGRPGRPARRARSSRPCRGSASRSGRSGGRRCPQARRPSQIARRSACGRSCHWLAGGHGMWVKWRIVASGRRSRIRAGGEVQVVVLEQEDRAASVPGRPPRPRHRRGARSPAGSRARQASISRASTFGPYGRRVHLVLEEPQERVGDDPVEAVVDRIRQ